jgi:hypothetical protein
MLTIRGARTLAQVKNRRHAAVGRRREMICRLRSPASSRSYELTTGMSFPSPPTFGLSTAGRPIYRTIISRSIG